jgi:hypothetical protein
MLTRDHKGGVRNISWDSAGSILLEGPQRLIAADYPFHQQMAGSRGAALSFRPKRSHLKSFALDQGL